MLDVRGRRRARLSLDERLVRRPAAVGPAAGWLRAVRQALGMTGTQVARRLGVTPQSVAKVERSEAQGSIRLDTLRRFAEALDCELVYGLVPREDSGFEAMVQRRGREIAMRELAQITHTMALEAQQPSERDDQQLLAELTEDNVRDPRKLWGATHER